VRFLAVGDVMLGRRVAERIEASGDPELMLRPLASLYASVDFTFANLETPLFSGHKPNVTPPGKRYGVLYARPKHAASLAAQKFSVVTLANNHVMDQGLAGLDETRSTLDGLGVRHVGAGRSLDEAWTPALVTVRGLTVAFIGASFTSNNDQGITRNPHVARIEDVARLEGACQKARAAAQFVVVAMHAGEEHVFKVDKKQRAFAKAAVGACADLVLGHHPHVVQAAEKVDGVWVLWSLGNFVFDQRMPDNRDGLAVEVRLARDEGATRARLEGLTLHPVELVDSAPHRAGAEAERRILGARGGELA
jgi:poly-gamma-glutamate capsule biosynthesis protein CapA/YwtB (metallophosphatase superfamily)